MHAFGSIVAWPNNHIILDDFEVFNQIFINRFHVYNFLIKHTNMEIYVQKKEIATREVEFTTKMTKCTTGSIV